MREFSPPSQDNFYTFTNSSASKIDEVPPLFCEEEKIPYNEEENNNLFPPRLLNSQRRNRTR